MDTAKKQKTTSEPSNGFDVLVAITSTLTAYANKHGLRIFGFSKDFKTAVFYRKETDEAVRVPYEQVLTEVEEYASVN